MGPALEARSCPSRRDWPRGPHGTLYCEGSPRPPLPAALGSPATPRPASLLLLSIRQGGSWPVAPYPAAAGTGWPASHLPAEWQKGARPAHRRSKSGGVPPGWEPQGEGLYLSAMAGRGGGGDATGTRGGSVTAGSGLHRERVVGTVISGRRPGCQGAGQQAGRRAP